MIELEEAREIVLSQVKLLSSEKIDLLSSLSRTLAEDVYADFDIPGFDRAAMDGYAVLSKDTDGADKKKPAVLEVIADVPAGYSTKKVVRRGRAVRIMTGAPMPKGADAVVMVEDTEKEEGKVRVLGRVTAKENVSFAGEDVKKGELILSQNSLIRPAEVAMLASLGRKNVLVRTRPRVAIISTGDELLEVGETLKRGEIYDSNSFALFSQVLLSGGEPYRLGIARDKRENLLARIKEGLSYQLLLLSGGVSVGDYDLVVDILQEAGVKTLFWKVAVKPGKPIFFGVRKDTLVFGLPGYPVSSMVNFENLVRPAIFSMLGRDDWQRIRVRAILKETVFSKGRRKKFIRVKLVKEGDKYLAVPASSQKSSVLKSMVWADAFLIVPQEVERIEKGEEVSLELLNEA
jgi:molybdopterin molybdotransferase